MNRIAVARELVRVAKLLSANPKSRKASWLHRVGLILEDLKDEVDSVATGGGVPDSDLKRMQKAVDQVSQVISHTMRSKGESLP